MEQIIATILGLIDSTYIIAEGQVGEVYIRAKVANQAGAYPGFLSMKRLGVFLLPLDGMLVHRRVTPRIKFASTHLYTWVERGTVGVKCLVQEHNTMSPARARTRTPRTGDERTNHEATAPTIIAEVEVQHYRDE